MAKAKAGGRHLADLVQNEAGIAFRIGLGTTFLPTFIGNADSGLTRIDAGRFETGCPLWLLYNFHFKGNQSIGLRRNHQQVSYCTEELVLLLSLA